MSDLTFIRTLVLVADLHSLAATARKLGISSAAVSKQLTRLEKETGLQLLHRSTRHVELTEAGRNYVEQCRRILEEIDAAQALILQMKLIPQGHLKVVSSRYFANFYIIPFLKEFFTRYPDIHLQLDVIERIPDLKTEAVDVLIGMSLSATGEVIQKKIASTHYVLCASPDYLTQYGKPEKPQDLLQHNYITHSMRQPNKEAIQLTPYIRVNDAETMIKLAQAGLGIIKVHHYMVHHLLIQGSLLEILKNDLKEEVPLYVAFPEQRYIPTKVRCFIDFITEKINQSRTLY